MSDEGEKTCPLCAEEMDLTDQQLKACRCGYELCVWCWNHIMEMAEKDETEGRCPACRTPYDKEKIVATAANCGRLVAEVGMEKRKKSQKAKSKTSESRKQLTNVRVIQRNLVYIVGLPLDLADEYLLQHEEYFGQYGKVLKVSISRTSAGTIQQFANSTCSVYITYAREDEAIRCIQSVHAFILDDRPLRACFGTTKYCHAWLRNMPCNNPDCLYLHDIGSHEDSFTKDEIISAYSRVQQITGITNNMQPRSGKYLPPPEDGYCSNSSTLKGNPEFKSPSNNSVSGTRSSLPSSSSGTSGALPLAASWGARASNCKPSAGSLTSSNVPAKHKAETMHGLPILASVASTNPQAPNLPNDVGKKHVCNEEGRQTKSKIEALVTVKKHAGLNSNVSVSEASTTASAARIVKPISQTPCSMPADSNEGEGSLALNTRHSINEQSCSLTKEEGASPTDVNIQKISVGVSSIHIDKQPNGEYSEVLRPVSLTLDTFISHSDHALESHDREKSQERLPASGNAAASVTSLAGRSELCNLSSDVQTPAVQNLTSETEDDFDNQRLRDAIVSPAPMPTSPLHMLSHLRFPLQPQADADCIGNYAGNPPFVYQGSADCPGINVSSASAPSNGFLEHLSNRTADQGNSFVNGTLGNCSGQFNGELPHFDSQPTSDMGESSIISNILSLELDSWDDTLISHQNLAKLIGENDKQDGSLKSACRKSQNSNQSRFSFARQEDSGKYLFGMEPTLGNISHPVNNHSFGQEFVENRGPYLDTLGNGFGFHHRNMEHSDNFLGGHSTLPSNQFPASRSHISAPPGFSVRSRPPPPGFSNEKSHQNLDFLKSGNQLHETSSFGRNPYQTSLSGNTVSSDDIEFIDPAILAVGKGRLSTGVNSSAIDMGRNFHVQTPGLDNELRLQLLMQRALSPHQILSYNDVRDNFSTQNDTYGFSSRHASLELPRNVVSNGQWNGWSESQSPNNLGMAELLRNDRAGFDTLYGGYEDSKCRMTNTGDLYNRSFGL